MAYGQNAPSCDPLTPLFDQVKKNRDLWNFVSRSDQVKGSQPDAFSP